MPRMLALASGRRGRCPSWSLWSQWYPHSCPRPFKAPNSLQTTLPLPSPSTSRKRALLVQAGHIRSQAQPWEDSGLQGWSRLQDLQLFTPCWKVSQLERQQASLGVCSGFRGTPHRWIPWTLSNSSTPASRLTGGTRAVYQVRSTPTSEYDEYGRRDCQASQSPGLAYGVHPVDTCRT